MLVISTAVVFVELPLTERRNCYEQPIFSYPSIHALQSIRALDTEARYQIKLYALLYVKKQQAIGQSPAALQSKLDLQTVLMKMEIGDDADLHEINSALAPLTDLIDLVKKIQDHAPDDKADFIND